MYGKVTSMAAVGREESQRGLERQRASLCKEAGDESQATAARGRQQARLFLRPHEGNEGEAYERKDRKRSGFED
jgi:hypothetical protein